MKALLCDIDGWCCATTHAYRPHLVLDHVGELPALLEGLGGLPLPG